MLIDLTLSALLGSWCEEERYAEIVEILQLKDGLKAELVVVKTRKKVRSSTFL